MINSAEEFVRLRTSENPEKYMRASTEGATDSVWMDIINNYESMKVWVVQNKTVPLSILQLLAKDSNSDVRFAVDSKRKLDRNLFQQLANDHDESVRQRIAYNKKAPKEILELLASDPEKMVSEVAKSRLKGM